MNKEQKSKYSKEYYNNYYKDVLKEKKSKLKNTEIKEKPPIVKIEYKPFTVEL